MQTAAPPRSARTAILPAPRSSKGSLSTWPPADAAAAAAASALDLHVGARAGVGGRLLRLRADRCHVLVSQPGDEVVAGASAGMRSSNSHPNTRRRRPYSRVRLGGVDLARYLEMYRSRSSGITLPSSFSCRSRLSHPTMGLGQYLSLNCGDDWEAMTETRAGR